MESWIPPQPTKSQSAFNRESLESVALPNINSAHYRQTDKLNSYPTGLHNGIRVIIPQGAVCRHARSLHLPMQNTSHRPSGMQLGNVLLQKVLKDGFKDALENTFSHTHTYYFYMLIAHILLRL